MIVQLEKNKKIKNSRPPLFANRMHCLIECEERKSKAYFCRLIVFLVGLDMEL